MKEILKDLISVQPRLNQPTTQNAIQELVTFNEHDLRGTVLPKTNSLMKRNQGMNDNDYDIFRSVRAYHTPTSLRKQDKNFFRITRKAGSKDQQENEEDEEYPTYQHLIEELLQQNIQNLRRWFSEQIVRW